MLEMDILKFLTYILGVLRRWVSTYAVCVGAIAVEAAAGGLSGTAHVDSAAERAVHVVEGASDVVPLLAPRRTFVCTNSNCKEKTQSLTLEKKIIIKKIKKI